MSTTNGQLTQPKFASCKDYVDHFLQSLRSKGRFVSYSYARGPRNWSGAFGPGGALLFGRGEPEGLFLSWEDDDGQLRFGWSLRNPRDEPMPFSRDVGLKIAIRRSCERDDDLGDVFGRIPRRQRGPYYEFAMDAAESLRRWNNHRLSRASHAQADSLSSSS